MIPLRQIHIPTPCQASWDGMEGDAQKRFCTGCQKHVHNLSEMTGEQAQALLLVRAGEHVCVRFTPNAAGTPQTREDVTRTVRPWRRRLAVALSSVLAVALGGLNAGCGIVPVPAGLRALVSRLSPTSPMHTMGSISVSPPPSVTTMGSPAPFPAKPKAAKPAHAAHHAHHSSRQSHHKGVVK